MQRRVHLGTLRGASVGAMAGLAGVMVGHASAAAAAVLASVPLPLAPWTSVALK